MKVFGFVLAVFGDMKQQPQGSGFRGPTAYRNCADVKLRAQNEAIWTSIIWRMLSIILRLFINAETFGLCHHSRQRDEDTMGEGTPIVASDV